MLQFWIRHDDAHPSPNIVEEFMARTHTALSLLAVQTVATRTKPSFDFET